MLDAETVARRIKTLCDFFDKFGDLTTCKRKPVGCGVFTLDCMNIPALSHNGPPMGLDQNRCKGDDPCGCGHSEPAAMMRLNILDWHPMELMIYTSAAPCLRCANIVITSRRIRFWFYKPTWYTTKLLETVVKEAGIMAIPMDLLELALPEEERTDYEHKSTYGSAWDSSVWGALHEHARLFYGDDFPFYHQEQA